MDADGEHEALGVDEQMPLAALDLLAAVVAAHAANAGRLDGLAVDDASAGLGIAAQAHPQPLPQHQMDPLPGAVEAPLSKVMVDRLPRRQVAGQQAPGPARPDDIEDGVENRAQAVPAGPTPWREWREQGLDRLPFRIREVRQVAGRGGADHASQHIQHSRVADFSDGFLST